MLQHGEERTWRSQIRVSAASMRAGWSGAADRLDGDVCFAASTLGRLVVPLAAGSGFAPLVVARDAAYDIAFFVAVEDGSIRFLLRIGAAIDCAQCLYVRASMRPCAALDEE